MHDQRYISPDLTHFVGRVLRTDAERYAKFKRILRTRLLKAHPRLKGFRPAKRILLKDSGVGLSSNQACVLPVVCFCDIPLCDLPLHMTKYGGFGVAFERKFLADLGAVPVIYIPFRGRPASLPYEGYGRGRVASQAVCFDEFWKVLNRIETSLSKVDKQGADRPLSQDIRKMTTFLQMHVAANLKFFNHELADNDPDNFYLEREWRVGQDVHFELNNVMRILIPDRWHEQFRRDFASFDGEVVFSDWEH